MRRTALRSYARAAVLAGLVGAFALGGCHPRPGSTADEQVWGRSKRRKGRVVMNRARPDKGEPAPVMEVLRRELDHNWSQLSGKSMEPPAYFLGYDLVEVENLQIAAEDGVLVRNDQDRDRTIDIDVRVGSRELDNSHPQGGNYGPGNGLGSGLPISLDDIQLSVAQTLWLDTEAQYHNAVASLRGIESEEQLRNENQKKHPDFSREKVNVHIEPESELDLVNLAKVWEPAVIGASGVLGADPLVLRSSVNLIAVVENRYYVNSEKTRIQSGRVRVRILLEAEAQAEDGMRLQRSEIFEAHASSQLPGAKVLQETAQRLREELLALRNAPIADPYNGPAVLEGRAAGVFFHEIFGHRLEGHRQKDDEEGQTFTDKIGKRVLPWFLDVVDDPTVTTLGGAPLSGHYFVDDEGVPSQPAVLVERGKLKGFLLGRSPVLPFKRSNGHGRRERGYQVVARQGNLIVTSRRSLSTKQLRKALIEEVERQGKPYGLWFTDIEGGYTITDRSGPQAFKVVPLMVYKVYPGKRKDELVRGVEIVGTPLSAFETIIATDDKPGIFNGMCGAESGWVPVSAVSPSLLLRSMEIERAAHERDKPPLLPPPGTAVRRRR